MNIRTLPVCLLLLVATTGYAQRIKKSINDGWRFSLQEEPAAEAGYDDTAWECVSVPHTWNALDTDDERPGYARGTGWYRRRVKIERLLPDERVHLLFEGANQVRRSTSTDVPPAVTRAATPLSSSTSPTWCSRAKTASPWR